MVTCEWCGHEHAREALCSARPRWGRRGFLALFGAGIVGAAIAPAAAPFWHPALIPGHGRLRDLVTAEIMTIEWIANPGGRVLGVTHYELSGRINENTRLWKPTANSGSTASSVKSLPSSYIGRMKFEALSSSAPAIAVAMKS